MSATENIAVSAQPQSAGGEIHQEGGPPGSGGWKAHAENMERERDHWRQRAQTMYEHQCGEAWYWQGDGSDHPESMVNSLPVVIRADQLRTLIAGGAQALSAAPAVPADSLVDAFLKWCAALDLPTDTIPNSTGKAPNGGIFSDPRTRAAWGWETSAHRFVAIRRMLAASPTPPAEQQAQPGAVYAELESELEAVGAGGVSGPLMGQPQAMPVAIRPDIQAVLAMLDVPVIARMSSHEGKLLKPGQEPPAFESAVPLVREWDHRRACESIIAALSRNR